VLNFKKILILICFLGSGVVYLLHENNCNRPAVRQLHFSFIFHNNLRQDVPLRERGSECYNSFIVLAFFNEVNIMNQSNRNNIKKNVSDYFYNEVVNKTNSELSIVLSQITVLADIFPELENVRVDRDEKMQALASAIKLIAETAHTKLHVNEEIQMQELNNVFEMQEASNA